MCGVGLSLFISVNLLNVYYCVYVNTSFFIFFILCFETEEGCITFS